MIADECIIEIVTAKIDGQRVFFTRDGDPERYQVEEDHHWDFENYTYEIHCLGHHVSCKKKR